jgi:hypothetical protein
MVAQLFKDVVKLQKTEMSFDVFYLLAAHYIMAYTSSPNF